jgi:hypothetical protein
MPSIINASSTGSGGIVQTADASGVLQLQSNGTVGLTVSTSGYVGFRDATIGTTALTLRAISNTYTGGALALQDAVGTTKMYLSTISSQLFVGDNASTDCIIVNQYGIGLGANPPTSGLGIRFPATQSASSNANTLDDYEEGTFTPSYSLGSGSGTFTTGTAVYTKIGRVVTLAIRFVGSSVSSAANLSIGGLPFPFANSNSDSSGGFREYATLGNLYILSFGSSTDVQMQRYDNNNGLPNGAPAWSGTFTYTTN